MKTPRLKGARLKDVPNSALSLDKRPGFLVVSDKQCFPSSHLLYHTYSLEACITSNLMDSFLQFMFISFATLGLVAARSVASINRFYHGLLPERQSHGHEASCFSKDTFQI